MRDRNNPAPHIFRLQETSPVSREQYFRGLLNGDRCGCKDHVLYCLLSFLALLYSLLLRLRAQAYHWGIFRSFRLPRPVISVGNITVGGTGKTPVTGLVATFFVERGKRVVILSRGYGGSLHGKGEYIVSDGTTVLMGAAEAGDEPFLLASFIPGVMVVIGADRYRAGLLAMERLKPDLYILDDGFQHLRLKRDLNILLLDCTSPFHNGRTLPAGWLREPFSAARRADLLLYTRCSGSEPEGYEGKPFCAADHVLTGAVSLNDGCSLGFADLKGRKGFAFAGIADPAAFFTALEGQGLEIVATLAFPDHTAYGGEELDSIRRLKVASRCDYVITTAKDAVKLSLHAETMAPIYYVSLEIVLSDPSPLYLMLHNVLQHVE